MWVIERFTGRLPDLGHATDANGGRIHLPVNAVLGWPGVLGRRTLARTEAIVGGENIGGAMTGQRQGSVMSQSVSGMAVKLRCNVFY